MRTALFLITGMLLLAAATILGRLFAPNFPTAPWQASAAFTLLWLGLAGFNFWVGVNKAGYSATEELPVFALIFLAPVAIAMFLRWRGI